MYLDKAKTSVESILTDGKNTTYVFPDFQRPYSWDEKECSTLWEDFMQFSPQFDVSSGYFLGAIVTYDEGADRNVIDGQQRITTLTLLLRAFYSLYQDIDAKMLSKPDEKIMARLEKCIWHLDSEDEPIFSSPRIVSRVAFGDAAGDLASILSDKPSISSKSRYAENYRFLYGLVSEFRRSSSEEPFRKLIKFILEDCYLLQIETDTQTNALRIFSTLNDRGRPLADSDIFKAELYKFYRSNGKGDEFISRWTKLSETCDAVFHPLQNTPTDEIFSRYMYYKRAGAGNVNTTTEALRDFYEKYGNEKYSLFRTETTLDELETLLEFWNAVYLQDESRFSERILKQLYILGYAPNQMYTYYVSVYFLKHRDNSGYLDDDEFYGFLRQTIGFIWAYNIEHPGVNYLRTPIYKQMRNIVCGIPIDFSGYLFDGDSLRFVLDSYAFNNNRAITKSMLVWWAYQREDMPLLKNNTQLEIEHIYAKTRYSKEHSLSDPAVVESIGNKAILEKGINIAASDYTFRDKAKYYTGNIAKRGKVAAPTQDSELVNLADLLHDFTEADIASRKNNILGGFIRYLGDVGLLSGAT